MLDWTDRHCRYFHRLLSPNVKLYTEMITASAIKHGDRQRLLSFDPAEHPLTLQLGGSEPEELAEAAKIATDYSYDEINLNCGCPSDRVQKGSFGACLMNQPSLVARCIEKMADSTNLPVTVKCRTGVDDQDSFEFLKYFIETVKNTGCRQIIIHARKAWLKGLSPKENREIPPLEYQKVMDVKNLFPELFVVLNGGITTIGQVRDLYGQYDGVMIGRAAYQNPYILAEIETQIFGNQLRSRKQAALDMIPYIENQQRLYNTPVKSVIRHMLGLFHGQRGGKTWRRTLSEGIGRENLTPRIIETALLEMNIE